MAVADQQSTRRVLVKRFLPLTTTSWVIPTGTLCLPLNRGDHPTPVLGRHPYSYPFHVQRLHPRKGLFGIHLDIALLAFAHLGARHALTVVLWMGHDSDLPLSCASARDAYPSAAVPSLVFTPPHPLRG